MKVYMKGNFYEIKPIWFFIMQKYIDQNYQKLFSIKIEIYQ